MSDIESKCNIITEIIKDSVFHEYIVCSNTPGLHHIKFYMKNENPTFGCKVKVLIIASSQIRPIYSFNGYISAEQSINKIIDIDFEKYSGSIIASIECSRIIGSIHLRFDVKNV